MKYSLQNSTITVSYAQIDILDTSKVIQDDLCKLVAISASIKNRLYHLFIYKIFRIDFVFFPSHICIYIFFIVKSMFIFYALYTLAYVAQLYSESRGKSWGPMRINQYR